MDSLSAKPQGKPKNTGVGSLSLLQWIFPTKESNRGLLHCRWILYQQAIRETLMQQGYLLLENNSYETTSPCDILQALLFWFQVKASHLDHQIHISLFSITGRACKDHCWTLPEVWANAQESRGYGLFQEAQNLVDHDMDSWFKSLLAGAVQNEETFGSSEAPLESPKTIKNEVLLAPREGKRNCVWGAGGSQYTIGASPESRLILIQLRLETTAPGIMQIKVPRRFSYMKIRQIVFFSE